MHSKIGVFKLLKHTYWEMWANGATWLLYTTVGLGLPMFLAWLAKAWLKDESGVLGLIEHGELYMFAASFFVYTLYNSDKIGLKAGIFRTVPYIALSVIAFAFGFLQLKNAGIELATGALNQITGLSIGLLLLSVMMSYTSNLLSQAKSELEANVKMADTAKKRIEDQDNLADAFGKLG